MDILIITLYNGVSKFTRYTAGISVPEIMMRVNLIIKVKEFTLYISHNSFPETMMRVNLIIWIKEFTLYIINNYGNTHLFTDVLSSGHLQIRLNSLSWSVGHEGPIRFLPS